MADDRVLRVTLGNDPTNAAIYSNFANMFNVILFMTIMDYSRIFEPYSRHKDIKNHDAFETIVDSYVLNENQYQRSSHKTHHGDKKYKWFGLNVYNENGALLQPIRPLDFNALNLHNNILPLGMRL